MVSKKQKQIQKRQSRVKKLSENKTLFGGNWSAKRINQELKKEGYEVTDRTVRNDLKAVAPDNRLPPHGNRKPPKIQETHIEKVISGEETSYAAAKRLSRSGFKVTAPGIRAAAKRITSNKTKNYEEK
jgi:Ribonuclease R winged-helix domain.